MLGDETEILELRLIAVCHGHCPGKRSFDELFTDRDGLI